jgi:hypothetical protein
MDGSGTMASARRAVDAAARRFVHDLEVAQPSVRVGVVEFNSVAKTLCQLTNPQWAGACIDRLGSAGGTRIDLGIVEGVKVLLQGLRDSAPRETIRQSLVVVSDGQNNAGCPPVLQAARQAKGLGAGVWTLCTGSGCDVACMRDAASSPLQALVAATAVEYPPAFDTIRHQMGISPFFGTRAYVSLDPAFELVAGSAVPAELTVLADGSLEWRPPSVVGEAELAFRVVARQGGRHSVATRAEAEMRTYHSSDSMLMVVPAPEFVTVIGGP